LGKVLRLNKNWSQEEVAAKLGMSVNGYAKIEQGKTDAHFSKLEQIAKVLEMNILELLSVGEKNIIILIGENTISDNAISDNICNNNNYIKNTDSIISNSKHSTVEIEKLKLMLKHKEQLLEQKDILLSEKDKLISQLELIVEMLRNKNE
jgi:transcriptional regulator with XRE-family HTH domain